MFLKYGDYQHASGEVSVVITKQGIFADAAILRGVRERWDLQGRLQAESPAALSTALEELAAAYAFQGQDVGFYFDDGTPSSHQITSSATNGGVRVVSPPSFPQGKGAEYSTFRTYSIALEAEVLDENASLIAWHERLNFSGGGPQFAYLQPINGLPIKQLLKQSTPYRATQSGEAVGMYAYPTPAAPLWPAAEHVNLREMHYELPKRMGESSSATFTEYRVTWSYQFESATPLVGLPTSWPE
jgi:hypothetical protein